MPDKMERCRECAKCDAERSTDNWVVLSADCPRYVIISQDSSQCAAFIAKEG